MRTRQRTKVGLVVETGEAREVHHFALLIGYGAGAVNPWLALDAVREMVADGSLESAIPHAEAEANVLKALKKGVVKVMSKMGISTVQSYRGAQIFEAVGLNEDLIDRYFTGTVSRISGAGLEQIAAETLARHARAFPERDGGLAGVDWGRAVPVAPRRRAPPLQPPTPSSSCSTPRDRGGATSSASTRRW